MRVLLLCLWCVSLSAFANTALPIIEQYQALQAQITLENEPRIAAFLQQHPKTKFARDLRRQWLDRLVDGSEHGRDGIQVPRVRRYLHLLQKSPVCGSRLHGRLGRVVRVDRCGSVVRRRFCTFRGDFS